MVQTSDVTAPANEGFNVWGLFNGFGSQKEKGLADQPKRKEDYSTEFHQLYDQFITVDITKFLDSYPLTGLVATVALAFFGLMNVLSFSPTNILTGAFLLTLSFCFAKGIWRYGILQYLSDVQQAIVQLVQYRSQAVEEDSGSNSAGTNTNKAKQT